MPPTTTERIEQEAKAIAHAAINWKQEDVSMQSKNRLFKHIKKQCITIATAEANRSKVLVEALEDVKKSCPVGSWFEKRITKALNTYNK